MKNTIITFLIFSSFCIGFSQSKEVNSSRKTEEYFKANFAQLEKVVCGKDDTFSKEINDFIFLLSSLSGVSPKIEYGMHITKKDLKKWKKWYNKKKELISWSKHIEYGLNLIQEFNSTTEIAKIEKLSKKIEKLRIE